MPPGEIQDAGQGMAPKSTKSARALGPVPRDMMAPGDLLLVLRVAGGENLVTAAKTRMPAWRAGRPTAASQLARGPGGAISAPRWSMQPSDDVEPAAPRDETRGPTPGPEEDEKADFLGLALGRWRWWDRVVDRFQGGPTAGRGRCRPMTAADGMADGAQQVVVVRGHLGLGQNALLIDGPRRRYGCRPRLCPATCSVFLRGWRSRYTIVPPKSKVGRVMVFCVRKKPRHGPFKTPICFSQNRQPGTSSWTMPNLRAKAGRPPHSVPEARRENPQGKKSLPPCAESSHKLQAKQYRQATADFLPLPNLACSWR